jgi:hypothetical protein
MFTDSVGNALLAYKEAVQTAQSCQFAGNLMVIRERGTTGH